MQNEFPVDDVVAPLLEALQQSGCAILEAPLANFVLMGYGEGAIMAVPGHDQRDWEFASKYQLPIVAVVKPADFSGDPAQLVAESAHLEKGVLVNSGELS